jgi:Zn-dependent M28 family amino/carboxypeptidase
VPNTDAHVKCADYLIATLKRYGAEVVVQSGKVTAYTGESLSFRNILARINPSASSRIMLAAHWDTRPFSDQDIMKPKARFDGAVDGAASVGILLEIARILQKTPASIGVDIVLFDAEDYGNPKESNTYCLGSQYFASNPPVKDFLPKYGILLDMVGATGATFYREGFSMQYAPDVMNRVWKIAEELGYSNYFKNDPCGAITDDHYFVNTILGVPTIDIIHHDLQKGFGAYWHTQQDNMDAVDKTTLGVVGRTILGVVYSEKAAS